jgi:hypothetical protein
VEPSQLSGGTLTTIRWNPHNFPPNLIHCLHSEAANIIPAKKRREKKHSQSLKG